MESEIDMIFSTDDEGVYTITVQAGLYAAGNHGKERIFRLERGKSKIIDFAGTRKLVD